MNFSNAFRKNLWILSPSELLTSALLGVFFLLTLGACFTERPGWEAAFWQGMVSFALWGAWLYFVVAVRRPPPIGGWGLARGLAPWGGLVLCYGLMKPLVPVLHPQLYDAQLRGLDLSLLGRGPAFFEQFLIGRPHWTDFFSVCYLGLFAWLLGLLVYHSLLRRALYQRFMLGLILVYIGGFLGYLSFPAIGPRFAYPGEWTWLRGGVIFKDAELLIVSLGSRFDVFPSLHGAISAYLLFWQAAHDRRSLVWDFL